MKRILGPLCLLIVSFSALAKPFVVGHRGARAVFPENTIPSILFAVDAGAEFVEIDIHLSKDQFLMVTHDPRVQKSLCPHNLKIDTVFKLTKDELQRLNCGTTQNSKGVPKHTMLGVSMPTLEESVLAINDLNPKAKLAIEIKYAETSDEENLYPSRDLILDRLFSVIEQYKLYDRIFVLSFDRDILRQIRKRQASSSKSFPISFLYKGEYYGSWFDSYCRHKCWIPFWSDAKAFVEEVNAEFFSPHLGQITRFPFSWFFKRTFPREFAASKIVVWTANKEEEWDLLSNEIGVAGIITDHPKKLIEKLKKSSREH